MKFIDLFLYAVLMLLACLPWMGVGVQTFLVLALAAGCFWQWYMGRALNPFKDRLVILSTCLFVLATARDFFGDSIIFSKENSTLLLFPVLLVILAHYKATTINGSLVFIVSAATHSFFALANVALEQPFPTFNQEWHIRHALGDVYGIHPTYLATIWGWASVMALHEWMRKNKSRKWLLVPCFLSLWAGILLSAGKMPLVATVAATAMLFFYSSVSKKIKWASVVAGPVLLIACLFAIPHLNQRFSEILDYSVPVEPMADLNSTQIRSAIWTCSIDIFKENILTGTGTSEIQGSLTNCYQRYGQYELLAFPYNTHNQLLHFALTGGVLGAVLFLAIFGLMLYTGWKSRNSLLVAWTVFMFLCMLTENYFSRQLGVLFMALWTGWIWWGNKGQGQ